MALSATVQRLRNKDNDEKAVQQDRDAFIAQWVNDISIVYGLFEKAMRSFVDDGDAKIARTRTFIKEEMLGEYEIDILLIEVVGRRVILEPKARITIGGTGRLDLYREDRPSEDNRILVVRGAAAASHEPNRWMIQERPNDVPLLQGALMMGNAFLPRPKRNYSYLNDATIQDSIDYVLSV